MSWTLIEHQALTSSAASVTLGSGGTIPQTYKTLKLVYSLRGNLASTVTFAIIEFNGSSANRSSRLLAGNGTSAYSANYASDIFTQATGTNATASTFSSGELVIPNYSGSTNKAISIDVVGENNATAAEQWMFAALWSNTAAITSMTLFAANGSLSKSQTFDSGSTFTLYGLA